ncbi:MAG: hypothetical protein ACERK1_05115 [Anaerolineales bacterium]
MSVPHVVDIVEETTFLLNLLPTSSHHVRLKLLEPYDHTPQMKPDLLEIVFSA